MMYKTMKELPEDMRPQEKILKHGPEILSNSELIALIIRSGTREESALMVAQNLIDLGQNTSRLKGDDEYYGLKFLVNATCEDLTSVSGIGDIKACKIMAAIELGRRVYRDQKVSREKITDTTRIPNIVMDEMRYLNEEHFRIALLNTKKELEYIEQISIGSIDKSIVEPREVFLKAIKRNAHTIILLHNHPSGDPKPSNQDINITKKLVNAGEILGVNVIDHIIIGDGRYFSFLEEGFM